MAIRISSAMLSVDAYQDTDGKIHLVNPTNFLSLPTKLRDEMKAAGKKRIGIPLPIINVLLWGGKEGDVFSLSAAVKSPNGREVGSLAGDQFSWHEAPFYLATIQPQGPVSFEESGTYVVQLDLNFIPTGVQLPITIYWEDESPPP